MFLDGDTSHPTICGTGLEDYVGSAWGMGRHATPYGGCTLDVRAPDADGPLSQPDFVGMYRWHLPDPVMYASDLKVTLQQIGAVLYSSGHEAEMAAIEDSGRLAGDGWQRIGDGTFTFGIVERVDDVCATAYVYCREPQSVERVTWPGRWPTSSADLRDGGSDGSAGRTGAVTLRGTLSRPTRRARPPPQPTENPPKKAGTFAPVLISLQRNGTIRSAN